MKHISTFDLNYIIDSAPGFVYWKDKDSIYRGCNHNLALAAGLSNPKDIVGKTDFDFSWKDNLAAQFVEDDRWVMREKKTHTSEYTIPVSSSNGKAAVILTEKKPFYNKDREVIGVLAVAYDITAQKEAASLRTEGLIMEEKFKTIQLFAASIAHEIRTPLASVSFIASTLDASLTELADELRSVREAHPEVLANIPEKKLQQLLALPEKLQSITTAANTFIDMMLMKVDLEKAKPQELITLSMAACITESVELYPLTEKDRALIQVQLANDFRFQGDPILIRHVFFNLIKNALHYVKAAGHGEISIWMESTPTENQLHFQDTGTGIPTEILPHIFSTFFSKTRHGTGVGLALCKVIIEECGGRICCESVPNEHTHFIISFPHQPH